MKMPHWLESSHESWKKTLFNSYIHYFICDNSFTQFPSKYNTMKNFSILAVKFKYFQDPFFRFRNSPKIRYAIKRQENEESVDKSRFAEWITPSHFKHLEPGTPEWNMAMFESLIELRDLGIGSGEFFAAEVQIIDIDNFTV